GLSALIFNAFVSLTGLSALIFTAFGSLLRGLLALLSALFSVLDLVFLSSSLFLVMRAGSRAFLAGALAGALTLDDDAGAVAPTLTFLARGTMDCLCSSALPFSMYGCGGWYG